MNHEDDGDDILIDFSSMDITIRVDGLAEFQHEMFPHAGYERVWDPLASGFGLPASVSPLPAPPPPEVRSWRTSSKPPADHFGPLGLVLLAAAGIILSCWLGSVFL